MIAEDPANPDLLFVGNDHGVYVSIDRGAHWTRMNNTIPNIPIRDIIIHPRTRDLLLGSYGRGIFVTNIAALEEMSGAMLAKEVHLFATRPAIQRVIWSYGANDYLFGQHQLQTPNEPNGMVIRYYLKTATTGPATIAIANAAGQEVARLQGRSTAGVNEVVWNMRYPGGRGGGGGRGGAGGGTTIQGPVSSDPIAQWLPLGDYTVTLSVAGQTLSQKATIARTQGWSLGIRPQIIR